MPGLSERQLRIRAKARARTLRESAAAMRARDPERSRRIAIRVLDDELRHLPPEDRTPVACVAGCDLCCHLRVMVTPVEVFGLLDYLRQELRGEKWEAFVTRLRAAAERIDSLADAGLLTTNLACPVLQDGRCLGYPARPFNCRSYHSLDKNACIQAFESPEQAPGHPEFAAVARVHEGVQGGFLGALTDAGVDAGQVELVSALAEALDDIDCRRRFRQGETVFRRARRPTVDGA